MLATSETTKLAILTIWKGKALPAQETNLTQRKRPVCFIAGGGGVWNRIAKNIVGEYNPPA